MRRRWDERRPAVAALLHRRRRGAALRARGRTALRLTAGCETYVAAARRIGRTHAGKLTIGFNTRWPDDLIPRILRAFRTAHPGVDVDLQQFDFTDTSVGLRTGATDLAFIAVPVSETASLHVEPLFHEPRGVILPEDHPLAGRTSVAFAEVLALPGPWAEPPGSDSVFRDFWSATEQRAAHARQRGDAAEAEVVHPKTPEEYLNPVSGGAAIGITYASAALAYRLPGIVVVPIHDLSPTTFALGWRKDDDNPLIAAFADTARRHVVAESLAALSGE